MEIPIICQFRGYLLKYNLLFNLKRYPMLMTDDEAMDVAFTLFNELASDNLNENEINLFNQYFNDTGFIELFDVDAESLEQIDFELHDNSVEEDDKVKSIDDFTNTLVEVVIGARPTTLNQTLLFAKIILSLNPNNKSIHIQWMSDLF